jgi:hypothetical protein
MAYQSISARLSDARTALINASRDADLEGPLAAFGYDAARIQEGIDLLDAAEAAVQSRTRKFGEQIDATEAVNAAFETAREEYHDLIGVARVALKGRDGLAQTLDLSGRRARSMSEGLTQMQTFYDHAAESAPILEALARFNVTEETLRDARARLDGLPELRATQEQQLGDAQRATAQRDDAVAALDSWMQDFTDIARIAFRRDPQLLEKLEITA